MSAPKKIDNLNISQEFKDLPPKHKALVALRALKDTHGLTNDVIAKALDYHPDYVSYKSNKLRAVDFVGSFDVTKAFETLKAFSKGEAVNTIKPKDKTVLSAATELIKIGTDHKDGQDTPGNLILNLNVLRGVDPKEIANTTLDDRTLIESKEVIEVKDIAKEKDVCDLSIFEPETKSMTVTAVKDKPTKEKDYPSFLY